MSDMKRAKGESRLGLLAFDKRARARLSFAYILLQASVQTFTVRIASLTQNYCSSCRQLHALQLQLQSACTEPRGTNRSIVAG